MGSVSEKELGSALVFQANSFEQGPRSNFEIEGGTISDSILGGGGGGTKHFFLLILYNF